MSKFRINSKKVFLTYPQTDITPEMVRNNLETKFPDTTAYIIAQENHNDTDGQHIHAYIDFQTKIDVKNEQYFDQLGEKHGNYQTVKDKHATIKYVLGLTEEKGNTLNPTALVKNIDVKFYTPKSRPHQAQNEYCTEVINAVKQGMPKNQLIEKYPQLIMKPHTVSFVTETFAPTIKFDLMEEYGTLRPYQQYILDYVKQTPHKRKLIWIYDKIGDAGKSELASHLEDQLGFVLLKNGKTADIAHRWNGENIVFDLSRTTEGQLNWQVMEDLKNGRVFSGKYESKSKKFPRPHLLIFSNYKPQMRDNFGREVVSKDRWEVLKINPDYTLTDITQRELQKQFNDEHTGWVGEEDYEQNTIGDY